MPRIPGAEAITLASPAGKATMSPASSATGGAPPSMISAQHVPSVTTWKAMTCSAPDSTSWSREATLGDSVTKGDLASTSKNTAPVSRTDMSTSESTSMIASRTPGQRIPDVLT